MFCFWKHSVSKTKHLRSFIQGISYWNVLFELTLTDRNMPARICLKVVLITWVWGICVSSTSLKKNYIGWPQQPPREKMLKFNMMFHDSTPKNFFSKHKNKAEFKCLDDSEVLSSDFTGMKTSLASVTSMASTASMASMTSAASFHQKIYWSWWFDHP